MIFTTENTEKAQSFTEKSLCVSVIVSQCPLCLNEE